jgi:hypothetical protein
MVHVCHHFGQNLPYFLHTNNSPSTSGTRWNLNIIRHMWWWFSVLLGGMLMVKMGVSDHQHRPSKYSLLSTSNDERCAVTSEACSSPGIPICTKPNLTPPCIYTKALTSHCLVKFPPPPLHRFPWRPPMKRSRSSSRNHGRALYMLPLMHLRTLLRCLFVPFLTIGICHIPTWCLLSYH